MGRTTNEPKTKTVKLRITEELLEEIEKVDSGNVSRTIRELIMRGLGKNSKKPIERPVVEMSEDLKEISSMAKCCGTTLDNMIKGFRQMLEEDEIHCQNGFMYTDVCPFNYKNFIEVCKDKNVNPQEALDRFTKIMERE